MSDRPSEAKKEYGTALVLARDFRHLFWYDDWKSGRQYIRQTARILEQAYLALGRKRAAEHVRVVTACAVENVQ